jgi:predicted TIM-barrel fold metal-dependent hydrolase
MTKEFSADSHAHIFCPELPLAPDRIYEPHPSQAGTARAFRAVLDAHGLTHGLLVGAQPYATDNRCLLNAIAGSGGRLKGIALVRADIAERELRDLADAGVVGIRINLTTDGLRGLTEPGAESLLARVKAMNWFVQIHCEHDEFVAAAPLLRRAKVRVTIDHFGRPNLARGLSQAGFQTLLEFGRSGNAIVKLSGPFRCSLEGPPYRDVDPYIAAAIDAFTLDNCVWGSDWPFVRVNERVDYGPNFACLPRWLPDPTERRKVLWDNPARLFGFR